MKKEYFINKTLSIIKQCENTDYKNNITGFKLSIEHRNISSITITTQVLLIFEQLFGDNFIYRKELKDQFEFDNIKRYLLQKKDGFLKQEKENSSQIHVNHCAFCGIGLLLLKEIDAANELADLLQRNRVNAEFSWGLRIGSNKPDILPTYITTMLFSRLHRFFTIPSFINKLLEQSDSLGIPYSESSKEFKYIEALTLAIYMLKFFYIEPVHEDKIKVINEYYFNGKESIYAAKESFFQEHPNNQWRIYGFGLASNIVSDYKGPFYESIFENLTPYFDKPETNIPYILELCRMYNAIVNSIDLFKDNFILFEIQQINKKINIMNESLNNMEENIEQQISNIQQYNREVNIKIPIATAFTVTYFAMLGVLTFFMTKFFITSILNIDNFNGFLNILDLVISIIVPFVGFVSKKTRIYLVKIVDLFYQKFNVHKDDETNSIKQKKICDEIKN